MKAIEFQTATLFTPGRGSYVAHEEGNLTTRLSEQSQHRAEIAAETFDAAVHDTAVFAGGYPGVADRWPQERVPPLGRREADLMSQPLLEKLRYAGWSEERIARRVVIQGESTNSIGDVRLSVEKGFLDPNIFHTTEKRRLDLVTGLLHGARFRLIIARALDIKSDVIHRIPMSDKYGSVGSVYRPSERKSIAVAKELAAIAITKLVLRDVRPGNVDDLAEAEQHFIAIASKLSKQFNPVG